MINKALASLAVFSLSSLLSSAVFDPFTLTDDFRVATNFDALYWGVHEGGMTFAQDEHHIRPNLHWNWGGRAGVDYKLSHDQWDLSGVYTYFYGHASNTAHASEGEILYPTWKYPPDSGTITSAQGKWHCNLNKADLSLGRNCLIGSGWMSIRPFAGISGLVLDQNYHITYSGGTAVAPGDQDRVRMSNDFWGVGLRFGFNSLFGLGKGFSVYADGAGSLLGGQFNIHQKESSNSSGTILSLRNRPSTVIPVAEAAVGFQWDYTSSKERYHFGAKLGWEYSEYFNQNRWMKLLSSTSLGFYEQYDNDLWLMGLTLGFRFDF